MLKIKVYIFFLFIPLFPLAKAQSPVGTWTDHLVYSTSHDIAVTKDLVYSSTGSSLLIYNKDYAELRKFSKINGLSGTGISCIGWSEEYKTLVIAYNDSNIDLLTGETIFGISDISRKEITGSKTINKVRTQGRYAYLATAFGIVVLDLQKKEVSDTWKPAHDSNPNEVWDICFGAGKVFAATSAGLYSAQADDKGLSYFGNWSVVPVVADNYAKFTCLVYSGNKLYINYSDTVNGDFIYSYDGATGPFSHLAGIYNRSIDISADGFYVSSGKTARQYGSTGALIRTISSYGSTVPEINKVNADGNTIWFSDTNSGLVKFENGEFTNLTLPGPGSNDSFYVSSTGGSTVICAGAVDNTWSGSGKQFSFSQFANNSWNAISLQGTTDAIRAVTDPSDNEHIFVASWGKGLFEYKQNNLVNHYDETNSPLLAASSGGVKICGLAFDKSGNLWLTQSGVQGNIRVLKKDGGWIANPLTIAAPVIGDIVITSSGIKWILLPRGYGIFIHDDNGTPGNFSDDRNRMLSVKDYDGKPISNIYSICEDLDKNIWIGTDEGPLVFYSSPNVFTEDIRAGRIRIPRNDGTNTAYDLLSTETITSVVTDGANRKWLGTSSSGAYLVSSDGLKQLAAFNETNSPLLSNNISSIAVDNISGDVWFATSKGTLSYRGNATAGSETFQNVYAFPNPVRPGFQGKVTVRGLLRDTQIRITDVSGNLVYETVSDGGEATWDLKTYNGRVVAPGVYLIFCAASDGSQAIVTKLLVVK